MNKPETTPRRRGRKPKKPEKILERLREYYQQYTAKECADLLGLPVNRVGYLLSKHNIKIEAEKPDVKAAYQPLSKPLSTSLNKRREQIDNCIRQDYPVDPTADIAERCDANYYTVARRAISMGVKKSKTYMRTRWASCCHHKMTDEEKEAIYQYLKAHFHDTPNIELANKFGVDVKTIRRYARKLGLQKSREFMQAVRAKGNEKRKVYTDEYEAWRKQRVAEVYPHGTEEELQALAAELGISRGGIVNIATKYGIRRKLEKYGPEFMAELREYFPTHTDKECARHFGISKAVIQTLARKHHIYKTRSHREKMFSSNITAARTANDARRK